MLTQAFKASQSVDHADSSASMQCKVVPMCTEHHSITIPVISVAALLSSLICLSFVDVAMPMTHVASSAIVITTHRSLSNAAFHDSTITVGP